MKMQSQSISHKVTPLIYLTYLAVIKNSVGANTWRQFYATVDGKKQDVMNNGRLSCAFFVSSILSAFGFITKPHGTVSGTAEDLQKSGWKKVSKPRPGCLLVWAEKHFKDWVHKHIGFYIGNKKAVSHSTYTRKPVIHHWTFGTKGNRPVRSIEAIYWKSAVLKKDPIS